METRTMGKVVVTALIENLEDLFDAEKGLLPAENVRRLEVHDVVDTGATTLFASETIIAAPGLRPLRTAPSTWPRR